MFYELIPNKKIYSSSDFILSSEVVMTLDFSKIFNDICQILVEVDINAIKNVVFENMCTTQELENEKLQ